MASQSRLFAADFTSTANSRMLKIAQCLVLVVACTIVFSSICSSAEMPGERFRHFMGFTLSNGTTLQDVQEILGKSSLVETGEAGEYEASICYKGKYGYVQFLSGELGGPEHELLGFAFYANEPNKHCAALPKKFYARELSVSDISLAMSRAAFAGAVKDRMSTLNGAAESATYEYKRPMTAEYRIKQRVPDIAQNYFDGDITITTEFSSDRLTRLIIWNTETL